MSRLRLALALGLFVATPVLAGEPSVRVSEVTIHGDMDCFKVETPSATYLYGRRGAGFASIIDTNGKDWISYKPGGKARGEYRGLPKCGQPSKFFHCGYGYGQYANDNPFTSRVAARGDDFARIESQTRDGKSACAWEFTPDHATMTLLRIDQPTYWFLYEGTPGGALDAAKDFVVRPDGRKTTLDEPWSQVVPWVVFGASETPIGLLLVNHQAPEAKEVDSYVSWPFRKEDDGSYQEMTVFGFGRKGHKELIEHVPDLKTLPARFTIALVERAEANVAKTMADRFLTDANNGEGRARYARSHDGDASRGKALFADAKGVACARCHRVKGEGGEIGPELSDVGGKFDRDGLIEAVLEPSRQIVEGYRLHALAMTDGRVLTGLVRDETEAALTLIDLDGNRRTVTKDQVEERKALDLSLMPDNVASTLSDAGFADLIAYLASLRSSGQGTPGSGVVGPVALPPGFVREEVAHGLTGATAMEVAPDGRVFVCEQTGTLRVVKDGKLLPEPFVRLKADSDWERGLLGVALDPDFAKNHHVYVCYVSSESYPHHRISRFTAVGDVVGPDGERILFEGDDQRTLGGNRPDGHQGGAIHFGRDGKLYVAIGDQTAGEPAQRLDTLQGKMLRLNPDGSIPDDNPFASKATGKYRAIWAIGLRNPFTFAVDPKTGRIFANDVGETRWEEIDEVVAGGNYGWPRVEGPSNDRNFRPPIHHYSVASIAGGAFCPDGDAFPAAYRGRYFFADFVKGWIKTLAPDHPETVETFATGLPRPVDLKFAPDGGLYVLVRDAWVKDGAFRPGTGSLHRIGVR